MAIMFDLIGNLPQVEEYASAAGMLGGCYDDWAHDDLVARKVSYYIDS